MAEDKESSDSDSESSFSVESLDPDLDRTSRVVVDTLVPCPSASLPTTKLPLPSDREVRSTTKREYNHLRKDVQGIEWSTIRRSREEARAQRLEVYENYLNLPVVFTRDWQTVVQAEGTHCRKDANFFPFHHFQNSSELSILHFQLRNLLWAHTSFEYYFLSNNCIRCYNSLSHETREVMNLSSNHADMSLGRIMVSTICVAHDLVAAGGFHGELVVSNTQGEICHSSVMTSEESGITNGIEIVRGRTGLQLVAANNDNTVRIFNVDRLEDYNTINVPFAANWASMSPAGNTLVVVGDDTMSILVDTATGWEIGEFGGHLDFSFAAAWHPNGIQFATGNQDTSVRIWDIRKLSSSLHMLPGVMSAVRSLRYTPCGRFLAAAEAADYVTIYDSCSNYTRAQQAEFFSEITGIAFTPEGDGLMVGLQDSRWGGFMEFQRGCFEGQDLGEDLV